MGWGRAAVRSLLVLVVLLVMASPALARGASQVSASLPRSALVNARVVILGQVRGGGAVAVLERRSGSGWVSAGRSRVGRARTFAIVWRAPGRAQTARLRVVVMSGRRVLGASAAWSVRVTNGRFTRSRMAVVGQASQVAAVPAPNTAGLVVAHGGVPVSPGQTLVYGYSSATPSGFLGRVTAVATQGSETLVQTQPTTLAQAGVSGNLDLSSFHEVGPGAARDRGRAIGHGAAFSAKAFNPDLNKAVTCSDGAQASLIGSVSVSVTPALHASFSLFGGLRSADFSLTGSAKASLSATAQASAGCTLDQTALFRNALHIATFEGSIGPVPVVVVLQGQLYVDGELSGSAQISSDVNASASITGGIRYAGGHFSPIFSGPNTTFGFNPPALTASAKATANVEPALQMLLYGVAGPQLGIKGGLDLEADTTANPWWTLTAPMSVEASLVAPDLDLNSGVLTLYHHTFHVADAGGPFNPGPPPPPPPSTNGQRTVTISWDTDQTDMDLHVWDPSGDEAWYQNQEGVPSGQLSEDITTGFGPETFTTTDTTTPLAIGVCYYASNTDDGSQPPTDVTVTITEANGSERTDHVTLSGPGDEQVIDTSPAGAATFSPNSGWCQSDNGGSPPGT